VYSYPQHWMEVGGEFHTPITLSPGKNPGGQVSPGAFVDVLEKRKSLVPAMI
jgi:hypothetical protein